MEDGCWPWQGPLRNGYGYIHLSRDKKVAAHRWTYELFVGPIPEGLTLDHLCRNRSCVKPTHLEPVTNRVNILRGESLSARRARQTHCKRGHPFTAENTTTDAKGRRICRACRKERWREWISRPGNRQNRSAYMMARRASQ